MLTLAAEPVPDFILKQVEQIYFRQSFIQDYYLCPMMAYLRWIINVEDESLGFFSALLGTAGHEVIFQMHEAREFNWDYVQIGDRFEAAFYKALKNSKVQPKIAAQYNSITDQFVANRTDYIKYLLGYQFHPKNHEFNSTMHEQRFVLEVSSGKKIPDGNAAPGQNYEREEHVFLFTGMLDQAGFYDDGTFALRDMKFRDNAYRPSGIQLHLDPQLTIYSAALRAGNPACDSCAPRYEDNAFTGQRELIYKGPCDSCKALVGTPRWPNKFPERCELIWMKDFEQRTEDEYKRYVKDNTGAKVPNPKGKGPKVFPEVVNPKWLEGAKAGDYLGKCFHITYRDPHRLKALMEDIIVTCRSIRKGEYYRRPGKHCVNWCKFTEQCLSNVRMKVDEAKLRESTTFTSVDPFA